MSSAKTKGTELSVAFGILDLNPQKIRSDEIPVYFDNTLSSTNFRSYLAEYGSNEEYYNQFYSIGNKLRISHQLFHSVIKLRWCGEERQAITSSVSKDIDVLKIPISVKAESNVVHNSSPHNIFISIPSGTAFATRTGNWYLLQAEESFQNLYAFVKLQTSSSIPNHVSEFERTATKNKRRGIQQTIKNLSGDDKNNFEKLYVEMCDNVSTRSAELFNEKLSSLSPSLKKSVMETVVKHFFRLNNVSYLLCGLEDSTKQFGLEIPDLTTWKRQWKVLGIETIPDLGRGQSVVKFEIKIQRLSDRSERTFGFHAEIRWSHGKFCGSPEAKLYKEFSWSSVPFFKHLI